MFANALTRVDDINVARVVTFTKAYGTNDDSNPLNLEKRIDGSLFPPCKAELRQHVLRTAYIAHLWSHAHLPVPTELLPTDYGWEETDEKYFFKWFVGDQLLPTITSISNLDTSPHGMNKFILFDFWQIKRNFLNCFIFLQTTLTKKLRRMECVTYLSITPIMTITQVTKMTINKNTCSIMYFNISTLIMLIK